MDDQKSKIQGPIEEALMRELRFGGIDKENLKNLVEIVAEIRKSGLKKLKVFPIGIPPIVDGLRVSGVMDANETTKLLGEILMKTPRLGGLGVFPYGIPAPEIFGVNIDIGATVETRAMNRF
ncbi:MAG: hypothetical protein ACREOO_08330 [bacterium]